MKFDDLETLEVEATGERLDVSLNRPDVRNAFDDRLIDELTRVLTSAAQDPDLRCLVLSGNGPVFCAGADLNWMRRAASFGRDENLADARRLAGLFQALDAVPFPTVATVQGAALGGGGGLVSCVDIAICAEDAKLGFTEVRLGIIPAVISAFVLRKIPRVHARRYFQTGEIFDGRRAAEIGLVSEAVPASELIDRAEAVVRQILSVGPEATRAAKRLVEDVAGAPYPDVLEATSAAIADLRATDEAKEGMAAFLEKRKPAWQETTS